MAVVQNISPHIYVTAASISVATGMIIFMLGEFQPPLFLFSIAALLLCYSAINFFRQQKGLSEFHIAKKYPYFKLLRRAFPRYIVWLVIILCAKSIYEAITYYASEYYYGNQLFFRYLLYLYLVLGIPYFMLTLKYKASSKEDFFDPAIRCICMFRLFLQFCKGKRSLRSVIRNSYNKKVLLNFLIRLYFIPIIVVQVLWVLQHMQQLVYGENNYTQFFLYAYIFSAFLWLLDVTNASLAYCVESRWLENRARSVDTHFTGWIVCLLCYEPLNTITGAMFPWAPEVSTDYQGDMLLFNYWFLVGVKSLEIVILAAHIYTTVSLGPSIANISLRKLQTRGFYKYIRHPGVSFKLSYWFLQSVFYINFWKLKYVYGYTMWGALYVLRAITEERHLIKYKEYQEYMAKVKYRFIPGLF